VRGDFKQPNQRKKAEAYWHKTDTLPTELGKGVARVELSEGKKRFLPKSAQGRQGRTDEKRVFPFASVGDRGAVFSCGAGGEKKGGHEAGFGGGVVFSCLPRRRGGGFMVGTGREAMMVVDHGGGGEEDGSIVVISKGRIFYWRGGTRKYLRAMKAKEKKTDTGVYG